MSFICIVFCSNKTIKNVLIKTGVLTDKANSNFSNSPMSLIFVIYRQLSFRTCAFHWEMYYNRILQSGFKKVYMSVTCALSPVTNVNQSILSNEGTDIKIHVWLTFTPRV